MLISKFQNNTDYASEISHYTYSKLILTLSLRTTPFGGFPDNFGFSLFFNHFLLILEKKPKSIRFCTKFYVKAVTILRSKCTSLLLCSKPVQPNRGHF